MKQQFDDATNVLEIIIANKKLTTDNYSQEKAITLAKSIWGAIHSYVKDNITVYQNWDKQDYEHRKKFVADILNMLLEKFDGTNNSKPKIYFKEEIQKLWPKQIQQPAACCYSPALSPWAKKYFDTTTLDASKPFFAFFNDLSQEQILWMITHEFTHYLQGMGKSSLSSDVVKQAAEYYAYYYMDKNKYKQIYVDSIHEVEANRVGKYVNEQVAQMMKTNNMVLNNDYTI